MTTFGDLRSAVHRQPSRENFEHLIALLEGAEVSEEAMRDEWVPYLSASLQSWPDDARACGKEQVRELERHDTAWSQLVRTLDYEQATLTQKRVRAIAAATHLAHIKRLDLRASRITWPLMSELVESAPFGTLQSFALRKSNSSGMDREVLEALFSMTMLSELEELYFDGWARMTGRNLELVLDTTPLERLRVLDISRTKASSKVLERLFALEDLANLEVLELDELTVPLEALGAATHLERLRTLHMNDRGTSLVDLPGLPEHLRLLEAWRLRGNVRTPESLRRLIEPDAYPNLIDLDLEGNCFGNEGLDRLVEATSFPALESLALTNCCITRYEALERMESYPCLKRLTIDANRHEPGQLAAITRAPFYGQLEHLSVQINLGWRDPTVYDGLFDTPLPSALTSFHAHVHGGRAILEYLGALGGQKMKRLSLPNTRAEGERGLSDDTVDALVSHPALTELEDVSLRCHDPTRAQIERLLEAFPRLEHLRLGKVSDLSLIDTYSEPIDGCHVRVTRW